MCILSLSFACPIAVQPATGTAMRPYYQYKDAAGKIKFTEDKDLAKANGGYGWVSFRKAEKVEVRETVWYKMMCFVEQNPGCTAQEIRSYMGWGLNRDRNHCDYFSTMRAHGLLSCRREGKGYIYWVSPSGKQRLVEARCEYQRLYEKYSNKYQITAEVHAYMRKQREMALEAKKMQIVSEAKSYGKFF